MIIIEGLDGTGKTTLKNGLVPYGFSSIHFEYDKNNNEIFAKYNKVISSADHNKILDRSFISEIVYGKVIRKHSRITESQLKELAYKCAQNNVVIVYLFAPLDVLLERRVNNPDDLLLLQKNYKRLSYEYERVLQELSKFLPILRLDSTETPESLVDRVNRFYQEETFNLIYAGNISKDIYGEFGKEYWGGSCFHSSIASALLGMKKIGVISGIGNDFDSSIFESLDIVNICGISKEVSCNKFKKEKNSPFILMGEKYLDYPPITRRIYTHHLHVSLRTGVPVDTILNSPMLRYKCLSVDVMYSSLDFAIQFIKKYKDKISIIFCNRDEYNRIEENVSDVLVIATDEHKPISVWLNGEIKQLALVPYNNTIIRVDGAGDSFIGGVLSKPIEYDLQKNLINGIAISWLAVASEIRYSLSSKILSNALKQVEILNEYAITKVPRHFIVIGNPCSGKSEFTNFLLDYFHNTYISLDDYSCLNDVFNLESLIKCGCKKDVINEFLLNKKAKTVAEIYLNLCEQKRIEPYTQVNLNGGYDIIRPELWDIILKDTIDTIDYKKHYIIQLSRGYDKQYLQYKSISEYAIYDYEINEIVEKLQCPPNDILIVNMTSDLNTRLSRNHKRKEEGGHFVSETTMKNVYFDDVFSQRYPEISGLMKFKNVALPYVTLNNNLSVENKIAHFSELAGFMLKEYIKTLNAK